MLANQLKKVHCICPPYRFSKKVALPGPVSSIFITHDLRVKAAGYCKLLYFVRPPNYRPHHTPQDRNITVAACRTSNLTYGFFVLEETAYDRRPVIAG
jgi:hypothetical protein